MTELHITASVNARHADEETKRIIAQNVTRLLAIHGDEPYARVSPTPQPVYVLLSYDPGTVMGETQGAFTTLADARAEAWLAHETYQSTPETRSGRITIETWEGGKFIEQRRLIQKRDPKTSKPTTEYVWEFSAAPTFNPMIEDQK